MVYRVEEKETEINKNMEFLTIVCSDLPGLIDMVLEKRERERDSVLIKISVDDGGGFLKICASIFEIDNPTTRVSGALSKKFLESGVKKILIVGVVPDVCENYVNVKRLWINCGVEKLRNYTVATELKLCNIPLGMMSHSSCNPCAWCDITKDGCHIKGNQRTISSLMNLLWDFFESRNKKSEAKKFRNIIHPPIIFDNIDDTTPVISLIPPPELHLLIGPVNKLYAALESEALLPPPSCAKFINTFKSFNEVVSSCYGAELHPEFKDKIAAFKKHFINLGISITPKVHTVMFHIADFCTITG